MSEFDPGDMGLTEEFSESLEDRSTLEKIYDVALQLYEDTRVSVVADRADVNPETARKYLKFLSEVGVLIQTGEDPDGFARNESYFDWRETEHLRREYSVAELEDRLEDLTETIGQLQNRYGSKTPENIDPRKEGYENVDRVYSDLRRWQDTQEEIDRILSVLDTESGSNTPASIVNLFWKIVAEEPDILSDLATVNETSCISLTGQQDSGIKWNVSNQTSGVNLNRYDQNCSICLSLNDSSFSTDESLLANKYRAKGSPQVQIDESGNVVFHSAGQGHLTWISNLDFDKSVDHRLEDYVDADFDEEGRTRLEEYIEAEIDEE